MPQTSPTIAVIVPNYNDSKYLPRSLRSLLDQESPPDEVIVVDDKSTDDSVAVIRSLIEGHSHAQLIENPVNLGTNGALNEGLKRTKSEYVLFLASNDFVLGHIFARARTSLAHHRTAALWSAMAWVVDEEDRPIRLHPSPVLALRDAYFAPNQCSQLALRHGNWFTGPTVIYRRETLLAAGCFDPAYRGVSDLLAALTVAVRMGAAYSPQPCGAIRLHPGSFLSRTLGDITWLDQMLQTLHEHGPHLEPRLYTKPFLQSFSLRMWFAAVRASKGSNVVRVAEKVGGTRGRALGLLDGMVPKRLHNVRILVAFAILRHFDILPSLWYRFLGTTVILLRSKFQKHEP